MRLKNRTALICGAAGPMGEAIAQRFLEEGARLVLTDISGRRLDALVAQLGEPNRIAAVRSDALVANEIREVVEAGLKAFKQIDIVVNVVGGIRGKALHTSMLDMTPEQLDETLSLNLRGILLTTQLVAPHMRHNTYGRIVNISSISMAGEGGQADYAAAKAGVAGMTRTMAIELAPYITVNCIAPALIKTSVLQRLEPNIVETYRNRTLLGRLGEPLDIANAALFLASDESAFITGHMLPVSGGIWPSL
jgi:3-oxoacyl-[acyl-carrier protein] reductase